MDEELLNDVNVEVDGDSNNEGESIQYSEEVSMDSVLSNVSESEEVIEEDEDSSYSISKKTYSKTITAAEEEELKNELERKKANLTIAREKLNEAIEDGDLSENEKYSHFKEVVHGLEHDIMEIERELRQSIVVKSSDRMRAICKGSSVHIVITSQINIMPPEDIIVEIVSQGHGGIDESGKIKVPENSEVYRNMRDTQHGKFTLTGTDGNNYDYVYEMVR